MRPESAIAATPYRRPRLARAGGWALLGAASLLLAWWPVEWLGSLGWDANWSVGPIEIGLLVLSIGFAYSGTLGVALWRTGHAGRRRAAGFAVLATPWLAFGWNAGNMLGWNMRGIPDFLGPFLVWSAGLLTAGMWMALAGLLLLPVLRSPTAVAWLLGSSAGFAVLTGTVAITYFDDLFENLQYVVAAWCAVHAAAVSLALPQVGRASGDGPGAP